MDVLFSNSISMSLLATEEEKGGRVVQERQQTKTDNNGANLLIS
jgi:hypothetical protein